MFDPFEDLSDAVAYTREMDKSRKLAGTVNPDIETRFSYHPPFGTLPERYEVLRGVFKNTAYAIIETTPSGREQSLALTSLEQAMFWTNAAIARGAEKDA